MSHLPLLALLLAPSPARAGEVATYAAAVERIEQSYLRLDELDDGLAFRRAAEAAEEAIPWLLVDVRDEGGVVEAILSHGDLGAFATVVHGRAPAGGDLLADLPTSLDHLEDAIRGPVAAGRATLPPGVDLPVELLRGAARALDRHSVVLAGARLDDFNERIKGRLVGVGCRIVAEDGALVVREVFPDSPATRGGLLVGDRIRRIDAVSTLGLELDDAVERIRGEKGTPVSLEIERPGAAQPVSTLRLLRDEVRIPNVSWSRTAGGAGHIRIDHFSQQTTSLLEQALVELTASPGLRGFVLDLRGNSGGSMLQAANVVDLFVDQGVILQTGGRDFQRVQGLVREVQAWPPDPESLLPEQARTLPLVVLVDPDSASASEIVAGALALLGRAVLLGTQTHGKGTVQQPFVVREAEPEGGGEVKLKLTIAEYHLAEGTPVRDGVGLRPDLAVVELRVGEGRVVLPPAATQDEALGLVIEGPTWRPGGEGDRGDLLLQLAEQVLAGTTGPERVDALASAAAVQARARRTEEARLALAMNARGVDWSPDDLCAPSCPAPAVQVDLRPLGPVVAGQPTTLAVTVQNRGTGPLHRVVVRTQAAAPRLPWNDLAIPVGFLPPGEEARAQVEVAVPLYTAPRQDLVSVSVEADRRPVALAEPVVLGIEGLPPPPVALHVGPLLPGEEAPLEGGALRLPVEVENRGDQPISEVQVRVLHPEDPHLEPLQREVLLPALAPGETLAVDLGFAWTGAAPPEAAVHLDLEVGAEHHGDLLRARVPVTWQGPEYRSLAAPGVAGDLPVVAPGGALPFRLQATDDDGIASLTAWWRGDKIAWRDGHGQQEVQLALDLELYEGTSTLVVDVIDTAGVQQRRRWYVRGAPEADATASP